MSIVNEITKIFGKTTEKCVIENFELYESKYEFHAHKIVPDSDNKLITILSVLKDKKVNLTLSLNLEHQEIIRISTSDIASISNKLLLLEDQYNRADSNEKVYLEIRIDKDYSGNLNIFDFSFFSKYLNSLSLQESLESWNKFKYLKILKVNIWEDIKSFATHSIVFNSIYPNDCSINININSTISTNERAERIEKRDKCGHFANASQFYFVPNDFKLCSGNFNSQLKNYFTGIYNSLLIVFLSDYSVIEDQTINFRLKGYKLLSEKVEFSKLKTYNLEELNKIYEWTYTEGNYTDKIGLSRNIISIHLENESILSIEQGTSDSVESGYDLYLKENVKQYIEIKNKISEFIQSQSDKSLEITKNMFSMFKTGLWTFTTFFITVFLLRTINKGTFSGAFNFEILMVSFLLIIFSFIYMFISILEINSDRDRLMDKYSDIRKRYQDLLNKKDLDKILNENEIKKSEISYINKKRNTYIIIWVITNTFLVIFVSILYCNGKSMKNIDNTALIKPTKEVTVLSIKPDKLQVHPIKQKQNLDELTKSNKGN